MNKRTHHKGMTLIELLVTISIFAVIMVAVTYFQRTTLVFNSQARNGILSAQDSRVILRTIVRELRSASQGNNGSYAIAQAATSTLTFFSDTDGDGLKEQIRYYLTGSTLRRGSIKPTGSPLTYVAANEKITTLASNIKNGTSTSLFQYFGSTYTGTSTTALSVPVTVTDVRLVKINLIIDVDVNRSPTPILYSSQVTLRNLKDNL